MNVRLMSSRKRRGVRTNNSNEDRKVSSLIQPVAVTPHSDPDGINVGEELAGKLKKGVALS